MAIPFPVIDPVLLEIGPLAIRWYSLSYIGGILLGWWYLFYLNRKFRPGFEKRVLDDVVVWLILGVILGGRLGYVLFYNPAFYLENPGEILAVWKGGMSFHGGFLGVLISMLLFCRVNKISFMSWMDRLACATPIGLFLGRIANFINGELYGRVTDVSWAVIFPSNPYPRHPSQIYQAFLEGIVLFALLYYVSHHRKGLKKTGLISGVFLVGYGILRSIGELFREPDIQIGFLSGGLTMGQMLSVPMILFGIYFIRRAKIHRD